MENEVKSLQVLRYGEESGKSAITGEYEFVTIHINKDHEFYYEVGDDKDPIMWDEKVEIVEDLVFDTVDEIKELEKELNDLVDKDAPSEETTPIEESIVDKKDELYLYIVEYKNLLENPEE